MYLKIERKEILQVLQKILGENLKAFQHLKIFFEKIENLKKVYDPKKKKKKERKKENEI